MAQRAKKTMYRVSFDWTGDSYRSNHVGVQSVQIGVEASELVDSKFAALKSAWDTIRAVVGDVEPKKMNCESFDVCE